MEFEERPQWVLLDPRNINQFFVGLATNTPPLFSSIHRIPPDIKIKTFHTAVSIWIYRYGQIGQLWHYSPVKFDNELSSKQATSAPVVGTNKWSSIKKRASVWYSTTLKNYQFSTRLAIEGEILETVSET